MSDDCLTEIGRAAPHGSWTPLGHRAGYWAVREASVGGAERYPVFAKWKAQALRRMTDCWM